ncbi:hypothetical protein B0T18DRAFT_319853 [Schizothecium vesticola]|uniref:Uncharacterized protein n=1 Tax=Schizothecium vesticola TaxID=314040 RepID=A0AA40F4V5_9PEZI|nr:hypothetical protein B0T18DRAFT_319853 [Schizothecium vesticola]
MPTNLNQGPNGKFDGNAEFPTDTYTVNGASVDSGYVSAIASGLHSSGSMADPGSMAPVAEEEFDAQTVYSDGASINGQELEVYKAELVDNLVREVRKLDASPDALERIFDALPALIKSFALQLGQPGSTKEQRDVMYFVHKYRQHLSQRFKEAMLSQDEVDNAMARESDRVNNEFTSSRIGEWLTGLGGSAPPAEEPVRVIHDEHLDQDLLENDEVVLPNKHGYRQVVFDSVPYRTLLSRLTREALLTSLAEGDAMNTIRRQILAILPDRRRVSRYRESETFTMVFDAQWNPATFLEHQFGGSVEPEDVLGKVITLTGSMSEAQALPCAEYLRQTWPATGTHILDTIEKSLQKRKQVTRSLPDGSKIIVLHDGWNGLPHFRVLAEGTADILAEVGAIISWLAAALRASPDEDCMACCTPNVAVMPRHLASSGEFECHIRLDTNVDRSSSGRAGHCWKGLFLNPVVVSGYPILRRPRRDTGLEIPLEMAANLVDAKRLHEFMGKFCLKGFSAMLAPIEVVGETVLWHLYYNATGERVSYLDMSRKPPDLEAIDTNVLRSSRHVIGWCFDAMYMFGRLSLPSDSVLYLAESR